MSILQKWKKWVLVDSKQRKKYNETIPAFQNCVFLEKSCDLHFKSIYCPTPG
ncbi:hypothetical protein T4A_288 [Trichinella pseudospiralis]|uniref:Uncharacterized protein n=1 Tax=Trichinella pseudospiralis TaxID=6337 RepID=A0A0V1DRJ7_TRIPS|nr:hypothetical protein T4A_288 [Trichinella pseudospiralis]